MPEPPEQQPPAILNPYPGKTDEKRNPVNTDTIPTPPYRLTNAELRGIALNADTSIAKATPPPLSSLAAMRAKMLMNHAGIPAEDQPQAAVEASYRLSFRQDTEAQVKTAMGRPTLLRVVTPEKLRRQPFSEHLIKV